MLYSNNDQAYEITLGLIEEKYEILMQIIRSCLLFHMQSKAIRLFKCTQMKRGTF